MVSLSGAMVPQGASAGDLVSLLGPIYLQRTLRLDNHPCTGT
jgi:hypothetical protein